MTVKYLNTYTVYFMISDTEKEFPDKMSALKAAEDYAGCNRYTKPFPNEDTWIFGPGDGSVSIMVRRDVDYS